MFVYEITSPHTNQKYVGHTTKSLKRRLQIHHASYNMFLKGKFNYISSFEILKFHDVEIKLLHKCFNLEELKTMEKFYINNIENTCNKYLNNTISSLKLLTK